MSKQTVVEIEPNQRRSHERTSELQFSKTELHDVAAHSTLVLATAMANAVLNGLEMRERLKLRRFAMMVVGALITLFGIVQIVMTELLKS
jgi:hypothetical protein